MKTNVVKIIALILLFTIPNILVYKCIRDTCDWSRFKETVLNGRVVKKYQDFKNGGHLRIETKEKIIFMFRYQVNKEESVYCKLSIGDSIYKSENETVLYIKKRIG